MRAIRDDAQTYFDACVRAFQFSGVVVLVHGGRRIWQGVSGFANREHAVLNTVKTKFRLASVTKPFTACAIMMLQDKGRLHVNDPIAKYMKRCPGHWKKITFHHLLTHTSGIPSYTEFPDYDPTKKLTTAELTACFSDQPLEFVAGENFAYSNSGYALLGVLIESISGKSYGSFLQDNIFDPLEMKNSGVDDNGVILKNRAQGYAIAVNNELKNTDYLDMSQAFSAGGLYSTAEDLRLWELALSEGVLLTRASAKMMFSPAKDGYACGWSVSQFDSRVVLGHAGGVNGFTTHFERIPSAGFCSIVLSNIENSPVVDMANNLRSIAFGAPHKTPKKFKESKIDPSIFLEYEGRYEVEPDFAITVFREGDWLMAQADGQSKLRLLPSSESEFFFFQIYAQIRFCMDENGVVTHLILSQNGSDLKAKKRTKHH